jgi:hypothetical protein
VGPLRSLPVEEKGLDLSPLHGAPIRSERQTKWLPIATDFAEVVLVALLVTDGENGNGGGLRVLRG